MQNETGKPEKKGASATPISTPGSDLLRTVVRKLRVEFDDFKSEVTRSATAVAMRAETLGTQLMTFFTHMGDIETRLELMKTLMIRKGICTVEEYEATWDEIKRLRVKDNNEIITAGDFVRVDFEMLDADGALLSKETNFPVRVGSGSLVIENTLLGRRPYSEEFEQAHTYSGGNPELAGKTVTFKVRIGKVKTSIPEVKS